MKFDRFWFNSFDKLVGPKPAGLVGGGGTASLQSLVQRGQPAWRIDDDHAQLIMQSVARASRSPPTSARCSLKGNKPVNGLVMAKKGQRKFAIEGAQVTIIGPLENRIDALRKEWAEALQKPTKEARQAALQACSCRQNRSTSRSRISPRSSCSSKSATEAAAHRRCAWRRRRQGLEGTRPRDRSGDIDLLKMPHHGSIRNTTERFLTFFVADHYVFSADGKYDNPDAPTIEAVVKMHGEREIELHFTNEDVTWSKPYKLEKNGKSAANLTELLTELRAAYQGQWKANARRPSDKAVVVELP